MVAAVATKGDVLVQNVIPKHLESITAKLQKIGAEVTEFDDAVRVRYVGPCKRTNIKTRPHPGFPTDMQPQIVTLLCLAQGTSLVTEGVWENRFKYVDELRRMGADIAVEGRVAIIEGIDHFTRRPGAGHRPSCRSRHGDCRFDCDGVTEIEDIYHIERGYEEIVEKIRGLGGDMKKSSCPTRQR